MILKKTLKSLKHLPQTPLDTNDKKGEKLSLLQQDLLHARPGASLIVMLDGFQSSGRGMIMKEIVRELDQRYIHTKVWEDSETNWPFAHGFWTALPRHGEMSIYFGSPYRPLFLHPGLDEDILERECRILRETEEMLAADHTMIVKLFVDISRETQQKRYTDTLHNPQLQFTISPRDRYELQSYDAVRQDFERVLEASSGKAAPWHVLSGEDPIEAGGEALDILRKTLEDFFDKAGIETTLNRVKRLENADVDEILAELADNAADNTALSAETEASTAGDLSGQNDKSDKEDKGDKEGGDAAGAPQQEPHDYKEGGDAAGAPQQEPHDYKEKKHILDHKKTRRKMSKEEYSLQLPELQMRAAELHNLLKEQDRSVVVAFEGQDAGGKGGGIKRLIRLMDPRTTYVATTASPSAEELERHYLWRFYRDLPANGNMTVFDRSWYGRVLVERVEGLTPEPVWSRAYNEINAFEAGLAAHGVLLMKFYLHISFEEQEQRFHERETDPGKQYKITPEDWRNRGKWPAYWEAANEMLAKTDTAEAPWFVIPGDDKQFARCEILRDFIKLAEEAVSKG